MTEQAGPAAPAPAPGVAGLRRADRDPATRYRGLRPALRRTFIDADPGRIRLRTAWTTALAVLTAIAAMGAVAKSTHQGPELVTVSGFMAMQTVALVNDATLRQRQVTMALTILPSAAAATIASVTMLNPVSRDVGIVIVVFCAVWLRRYGPRGSACGVIGFFAYFFTILTDTKPHALPMLLAAIAVGVGSALFVRTAVVPERPRAQLRTLLPALRDASTDLLDAAAAEVPEWATATTLGARWDALGRAAAAVYDWQDRFDTPQHTGVTARELDGIVFDVQLSIEHAAQALLRVGAQGSRPAPLTASVNALRAVMATAPATAARSAPPAACAAWEAIDAAMSLPAEAGDAARAVHRAAQAQVRLRSVRVTPGKMRRILPGVHAPGPAVPEAPPSRTADVPAAAPANSAAQVHSAAPPHSAAPASPAAPTGRPAPVWRSWDAATRAAVQCSVAAAAAALVGRAISADRWYWAVLTAFMIFYGATTSGDVLARAWRRMLGTVLGVVAALVIVYAIGHHPDVLLPLIAVYALLGQYFGPLNYAYRIFFITLMLASLYELLGIFDLRVMEVRIDETLAGAAVGIAAAFFVLSTRSTPVLATRIGDYLTRLGVLVSDCGAAVLDGRAPRDLRAATRELDAALAAVGKAADPLETVGNRRHRRQAARWNRRLQANSRFAHELVGAVLLEAWPDGTVRPPDPPAAFEPALHRVLDDIAAATRRFTDADSPADGDPPPAASPGTDADRLVGDVLHALPPAGPGVDPAYRVRSAAYALGGVARTLPDAEDAIFRA
ncbi:FUSC family protein [Tomitella gaofuii]|uniref:FUSC family protein n=1 Tax=Tomitella gaofuii TaxID=2760083 RepID=UPI0015FA98FC|nr:FUSC family protein [Tomitella gaofuii]